MALAITHLGNAVSGSDLTTYDFGDFSAAEAGMIVVVAAGYAIASGVSSVSIGGTNGTIVINASAHDRVTQCIAVREVSSGNHNVSVTFAGGMLNARVSVYLLTGYDSTTPSDTDFVYADGVSARTATLDFPTDGIAVYGFEHQAGTGGSVGWSAATEVYDNTTEFVIFSAAHKTASGAGNTETATISPTDNGRTSIIGAVWAPSAGGGGSILPLVNNIMLGGVI